MDLPGRLFLTFVCPLLFLVVERFQAEKGRPWITPNLLTDICVGLLNVAILTALLSGFAFGIEGLIHSEFTFLEMGLLNGFPPWAQLVLLLLITDVANYLFHRMMHSTKPLWVFHAVHHAQFRASPMLQNRGHLVDQGLFFFFVLPIVMAIVGAPPAVYFSYLAIDQFWDYFIHSDIKVNLGPLKYIISTPQYHRIHHSLERRHFDKNFGTRLIIWDYLFGTLHPCFDEYPEIGIEGYPVAEVSTSPHKVVGYAIANFLYPFRALWLHFLGNASANRVEHRDTAESFEPAPGVGAASVE